DIHRQVANNYVEPVEEQDLREGAINGMLQELDPFSVYVPPAKQEDFDRMLENSFKGVGIQLDQRPEGGPIEVVTPIDGSPAFRAGVQAGDVITKVNGESVEGQRLPDVVKKIAGKLGTDVRLTVRHMTGEEVELTMTREEIIVPTIKGFQRKRDNEWDYWAADDPKIAYMRITQFTSETFDNLKGTIEKLLPQGMQGLILDLRFNPGGRLDQAIEVCDLFLDKGTILITKGRTRPEQKVEAKSAGTLPYFPIIVLINEHSASASEIVAGSLMDNKRALVIGQRSYGKGSVQELIPLDNKGGELKLTVAYYYLPSGRLVHKKKDATDWGVQPQITVPMTPEQERAAMMQRYEQELFKRPVIKATTRSATQPATTQSASVVDAQLQRAIDTIIALVVLNGDRESVAAADAKTVMPSLPTTQPATTSRATTSETTSPTTAP
ncbi:MAG: carboxyl-terminal processing protease, partial [Phycisphaerales bacterium]|nr:carboxyl-terminal processing protease [Phycisphaerales bacterium]